jgi:hypothetical protein
MRVSLTTPSIHLVRSLFDPKRLSTVPKISFALFCGMRTLVNSSGCWLLFFCLFNYTSWFLSYRSQPYVKLPDVKVTGFKGLFYV